jgi:hypothetical protein
MTTTDDYTRLFPLLASRFCDGRVQTTKGPGRLLSAFRNVCHVVLDSAPLRKGKGKKQRRFVEFLRPCDVWPMT